MRQFVLQVKLEGAQALEQQPAKHPKRVTVRLSILNEAYRRSSCADKLKNQIRITTSHSGGELFSTKPKVLLTLMMMLEDVR